MKVSHILTTLAFVMAIPASVMGNAVVQEKYHFFTSAQYSYYDSEHIFNASGERKPAHDDFTQRMGETYTEVGVTDLDTVSLRLGWAKDNQTLNGSVSGFCDMVVGWKRDMGEFYSNIIAIEVDAIIPFKSVYKPGLSYGKYGAEVNLLASKGFYFWDRLAWYDLRLGYLWYAGFPSDQVLADASINYHPIPKLFIQIGSYVQFGLLNGHSRNDRSLFFYNPNYRLWIGKIEATYCLFNGISVIGGYDRFLWGRNVGTGGRFYCGLQYQL